MATTLSLSATRQKQLNVTLGAGADSFQLSVVDTSITVGGQGGATIPSLLTQLATKSYYGGGKGKDIFAGTTDGGLAANSTIVGGSEADTIGLSSTAWFQNGAEQLSSTVKLVLT